MRQSNGYLIIFTVAMTVICAGLLAGVAELLKPQHKKQVELDKKSQILGAVRNIPEGTDVLEMYDKLIEGVVVNHKGEIVTEDKDGNELDATFVNVEKQFKKPNPEDKLFPVFKYMSEVEEGKVDAYIVPVYGNGLWDNIWGFIAIQPDMNTIKGAVFDHKAETPGLGADITTEKFQSRFEGKQIFDDGEVESVLVLKGESNDIPEDEKHKVDGLSGATMTCNGVTNMLEKYFKFYEPYFKKIRSSKPEESASGKKDLRNSL